MNDMVSNFLSSLTGNTNKAYILLRKEITVSRADVTGAQSGMAGLASSLSGQTFQSRTGVMNAVNTNSTNGNFLPVQVQYNPNSIRFAGTQGRLRRAGVGAQEQFAQMDVPVETIMTVDLDFDDTNIKDAFMYEKLNVLTVGGALQSLEQIGAAKTGGYSIQDISEVFVGAMVRPSTRWVAFVWNKMVFWGELNNVNVKYTMFNISGNPIRSKVSLKIRQDCAAGTTAYETERQWEAAFNKMFTTNYKTNALGVTNKMSNLIQF